MAVVFVYGLYRAAVSLINTQSVALVLTHPPRLDLLACAAILMATANVSGGIFWRFLLASLGGQLSSWQALNIWTISGAGKYGLGPITQYGSRIYLSSREGVPRATVLASLALELPMIVLSGVAVFLATLPLARINLHLSIYPLAFLAIPLAVCLLFVLPRLALFLCHSLPKNNTGNWSTANTGLRVAACMVVVNWLLLGVSVFVVASSLEPIDIAYAPTYIFATTVAMLAGLLAFTPLGVGVRDGVLVVVLAQLTSPTTALATALTYRFLGISTDLLCGAFFWGWSRILNRAESPAGRV